MTLPNHLFLSSDNGALYDTRVANWSKLPPLRAPYCASKRDIRTVADLKATLRAGRYTDLGCYPLYFIASDGEALSFDAVRTEFRNVASAIREHNDSGWRVVHVDINYEDTDLYCAHTGERIESAYGEE